MKFVHLLIVLLCLPAASSVDAQVFTFGGRYATGPYPQAMVAADFDGDLDIDLAVRHRDQDSVKIFLNDGNADFSSSVKLEMSRDGKLYTGDFNDDGYEDLLLYDGGWISDGWGTTVYLNNGDATFARGMQDTLGSHNMCVADFQGDGLIDIVVGNALDSIGIWIFRGTGGGTFAEPVMIEATTSVPWVTSADLDDDGDEDILFSALGPLYSMLNDGAGNFAEPVVAGETMGSPEIADLNGDQFPDMVGTGQYSCGRVPDFMIGNGDGTFGPRTQGWIIQGVLLRSCVTSGDFNSDGFGDIVFGALDFNRLQSGFNDGRQWFRSLLDINHITGGANDMIVADFDNDGDPDLATITSDDSLTITIGHGNDFTYKMVVPTDVPDLETAVDLAPDKCTLIVEPGTYYVNLDFGEKNLVLMSSDYANKGSVSTTSEWIARSSSTTLDGGGTDRVVTFDDFQDDRSVLAGFTIQNGNGGMGGGIYTYDTASPTIMDNIIRNNTAVHGAGIFLHKSKGTVKNNLIIDNTASLMGGGMYASGGSALVANNTFYGNSADDGGGLYYAYGSMTVCNNIIWGNSAVTGENQIKTFTTPEPVVVYCNIQGGFAGEGNIDQDPMFVDPDNDDFTLMPGSPCINSGDPAMPLDPDGTPSDMGAYAYFDPTDVGDDGATVPANFEVLQNYPNPFNPQTTISYDLPAQSHVVIDIYNILGRRVVRLLDVEQPAGTYTIVWNGCDAGGEPAATGIYFYRISAGRLEQTRKMILLK